jgi:hypothetical protein
MAPGTSPAERRENKVLIKLLNGLSRHTNQDQDDGWQWFSSVCLGHEANIGGHHLLI